MQFKEFVERMMADDGLKARFIEVAQRQDEDALIAFLADEGCETTMEEIGAAMAQGDDEELDLDSLDGVAGGISNEAWLYLSCAGGALTAGLAILGCNALMD